MFASCLRLTFVVCLFSNFTSKVITQYVLIKFSNLPMVFVMIILFVKLKRWTASFARFFVWDNSSNIKQHQATLRTTAATSRKKSGIKYVALYFHYCWKRLKRILFQIFRVYIIVNGEFGYAFSINPPRFALWNVFSLILPFGMWL